MKKRLHFLSGIPRSGSTVLAAILNQNPRTHVSTTSGLVHALDGIANTWAATGLLNENDHDRKKLAATMRGMVDAFYEDTDKPVIIDKSRGWPIAQIMQAMGMVLERPPRIIATVRSVPDCAASFVRVAKPKNLDEFIHSGQLMDHLRAAYISLQNGYLAAPENFLFVEYDELLADPKGQLKRIHKFLGLPSFAYDFARIDGSSVKEDDENLHGYAGMHDVKPKLERQHKQISKDVLGRHYYTFCQPEFWQAVPKTRAEIQPLDLQLSASTTGDFKEGWRLAQEIEKNDPLNNRAAYNRGWYYLSQGKLQEGFRLLDRGRIEGVFGNKWPDVPTRLWDGKSKGIVLLYLEGGLGDQMHQVRFAKAIAERGCKVIVACTGQLALLFVDVEGVSGVVQHEAMFGVYHDFWVAGMSAVVPLGYEYDDISGKPYISRPKITKNAKNKKRPRIGLRWLGNPRFEHEQHRVFEPTLLFDAVREIDADFICLQRDAGAEARPKWCKEVPLSNWSETREAIASCDLVITSCTSIAHLAAAMGVLTWVITPVMPYYLWALPGPKAPWYDSVRLFRQKKFGEWNEPFDEIKTQINKKYGGGGERRGKS